MNDPLVDSAIAAHAILDRLPEPKRAAAAQLLDLPIAYPVAAIVAPHCNQDGCDAGDLWDCDHDHEPIGTLTAGQLLSELISGKASPETVWELIRARGAVRPGTESGGVR